MAVCCTNFSGGGLCIRTLHERFFTTVSKHSLKPVLPGADKVGQGSCVASGIASKSKEFAQLTGGRHFVTSALPLISREGESAHGYYDAGSSCRRDLE